ncbi:molybdenum cofactor biosynthesis protein MoaB [Klebsiella pneumoniae subsp. ozaenae]|uniref:Molybdenum cofactor biosynthesis protein MoaB n=1 Tax=Klebsiella pneumoniae subsp. ozaenae TaxID=574 RepID=A0A378BQN4_KLEPO|nr:molybdenum cofactor biosynthesis protein MoaB [Klebsiella pneumoniae subsp. ozaenae]
MSQASAEFIPTPYCYSYRFQPSRRRGRHFRSLAARGGAGGGHQVVEKAIVKENRYAIRAQVSAWIASDNVQVVLITGGTGFYRRRSGAGSAAAAV